MTGPQRLEAIVADAQPDKMGQSNGDYDEIAALWESLPAGPTRTALARYILATMAGAMLPESAGLTVAMALLVRDPSDAILAMAAEHHGMLH